MSHFAYRLGGLQVQSDFPLHGLLPQSAAAIPDIRIVMGTGTAPRATAVFAWPGRYGLRLGALDERFLFSSARDGAFLVSATGDQVQCFADPIGAAAAADGMAQLLMRRVLPRVAQLHGRTALHGATIVTGDGDAILLLGASGAGKSTLSVALHEQLGWSVLSDDISLLDAAAAPERCFSVVHGACLWPDSLEALASPEMRSHELPAHDQKRWREFDAAAPVDSARVRAVVFLAQRGPESDEPSLRLLPPLQALIAAMRQLVRFNPLDKLALQFEMGKLARLLQHTPAYTLAYPRSYSALPAVARRLQAHFAAPPVLASMQMEPPCR